MRKTGTLLLLLLFMKTSWAQTDTAFWFAAPDIEIVNHPIYGAYDRPIYLRLTSLTAAANVTVSIPANAAFAPITINIPASSTSTVDLTAWIDLIENSDPANIGNKGLYIRSSSDITAYYEVNSTTCNCNPEFFSLKGRNALGNNFYVPSQVTWSVDTIRHPNARAGFDIVATQNSTTVTITPSRPLIGHAAGAPFTITLNKGQSFACIALYRNGPSMLNGSTVVSDKPVAVTAYEDLLFSDGACADLAGDQLIPTSIFGTEFAVVRGNLTTRDKVIITASQAGTAIYLNGSATATATINAGQSFEYDLTPPSPTLYIQTSKPASVFHYTGTGCEVGAAVIPKLTCTGSSSVSIVRTSNGGNASVMLVTKNGNQANFLVNGVAGVITAADFSPLAGTGGTYVYAKKDVTGSMPLNTATTFSNTSGKFQLGFFNVTASNGGCMYGFFSDFKKSNVSSTQEEICLLDSVQLNATGGITYQWTPAAGLSNPNISNPKASPAATTTYKVTITDIDGCVDSSFVKVIVNNCSFTCNNWLFTPAQPAYVTIGDLDITGNQLTIEAIANRTSFLANGVFTDGDLVTKHSGPGDANYILRPTRALITTNNGFFFTPDVCPIELNKTYHYAMVYNGTTLKFYRNGFLMSQVPASGNLTQNDLNTTIAWLSGHNLNENFVGYINEVRIWNVARTQTQLQANMNSSLPNPTTQPGLLAYYTFDDLINKQGNATYNGTLGGGATINITNPNCTFTADSCALIPCATWLRTQAVGQSVTVGDLDISGNQLTIEGNFNCTAFPVGTGNIWEDIVSKHSGTNDCNYALRMNLGAITTSNGFFRTPPISCEDVYLNKTYHAAMVYDGSTLKFYRDGFLRGQIAATGNLVLNNLLATIGDYAINNPQGTNFVGYLNEIRIWNVARTQAQIQAYMNTPLPNPSTQTGLLGYYTFDNLLNKQGNATYNGTLNGGATINNINPNCTFTADSCALVPCATWLRTQAVGQRVTVGDLDISGNQMTVEANFNCSSFPVNRPDKWEDIVSKHSNTTDANYVLRMDLAAITTTTGHYLTPPPCDNLVTNKTYHVALVYDGTALKLYRDGVVISQIAATGNLILNNWLTSIGDYAVNNPVGTNFLGYINEVRIWNVARTQAQLQTYMNSSLPNPASQTGLQGYYIFNDLLNKQGNATYNGTLNGGATINNTNPNCSFTPELIAMANAGPDTTFCSNTAISHILNGSGTAGGSYSWTPAIYLNNPNSQNPIATISATTTFYLTVNSPGLCPAYDTVTIFVNAKPTVKTINDSLICSTSSIVLTTTGAQTYSWTPTIFLSNPAIASPVFSGNQSQTYYVTGTDANGCKATDTLNITVNVRGSLLAPPDKSMCGQTFVQLDGNNGNNVSYLWSPATYLSSTTIINPIANPPASTVYTLIITDKACGYDSTFTVRVLVGTGLAVSAGKSNDIDCANKSTNLFASGGDTYVWTPSTGLNNPNIPNPIATPPNTQQYIVHVTNNQGCSGEDTVIVYKNNTASLARYMPNTFTPNGDGLNDCYGLKSWMYIRKLEFRIFNRYGEQVFGTSDPSRCWDGIYKGKIADQGTYVFYIKAETSCGTEEQKGTFLLLR